MITNQKEEAMGYQRISLPQSLLMAGVLLCAFVIAGCGSNESPPSSRQGGKPAVSAEPLVKELFPKSPAAANPQALLLGRPGPDLNEVAPPDGPQGVTLSEMNQAAAATPFDSQLFLATPPDGPTGIALSEVKANASTKPNDPQAVQVLPPGRPGDKTLSVAEVKASANKPFDPELILSTPPDGPGGVTLAQVKARAAATELIDPQTIPPPPNNRPGAWEATGVK